MGATAAFGGPPRPSNVAWKEIRERYPHGVASGDPTGDSVLVWTRWAPEPGSGAMCLYMEMSPDPTFATVVAQRRVTVSERTDWTCRLLVGGLLPSTRYWFRFTDEHGRGSRIGRTCTAPAEADERPVRFAFVSCQNVNMGPLTAWRRMIHDDLNAAEAEQLEFVLHLGDFVYDAVYLPEERPNGYFDRKLRHIVDYPDGERHDDYRVPTSLRDYRALYRAYLQDPDLQDARARWPFVAIWDNGEYSGDGWQGLQRFGHVTRPAQTRKVAANQAWFEYIPARVRTANGSLSHFAAPTVADMPITRFDADGLGLEADNLAAIRSLIGYRALRWGRHVELMLTDQRSFRSEDYTAPPEAAAMASATFPQMVPFESLEALDAGATANGGAPPPELAFADKRIPNYRSGSPPRTLLGSEQRQWLAGRLSRSAATWKIWGDTVATLDMRADPQNLPPKLTTEWPGENYAGFARTDHSTAYTERRAIYDHVAEQGISGFAILSGDRHSFWAGYAAKSLPPAEFRPCGVAFVVGSINSPGFAEALEHTFPADHPLRPLYLADVAGGTPEPAINLLLRHGVRTCLEYAATGDLGEAKRHRNPGNAPHVEFVDMAGHGFGIVTAGPQALEVDFVCIPRPVEPVAAADGGPIRYRVTHRVELIGRNDIPRLVRTTEEGQLGLSA